MPDNTPKTDESGTPARVLDYRVIPITLSFEGVEPIGLLLRRQLGKELKAEREAFFAKTEAEQDEMRHPFRVNMMANLLMEKPTGIPDFPDGPVKEAFVKYFGGVENEELLTWLWGQYQVKLYPKELMSSLSES